MRITKGQLNDVMILLDAGIEAIQVPAWLGLVLRIVDNIQNDDHFFEKNWAPHDARCMIALASLLALTIPFSFLYQNADACHTVQDRNEIATRLSASTRHWGLRGNMRGLLLHAGFIVTVLLLPIATFATTLSLNVKQDLITAFFAGLAVLYPCWKMLSPFPNLRSKETPAIKRVHSCALNIGILCATSASILSLASLYHQLPAFIGTTLTMIGAVGTSSFALSAVAKLGFLITSRSSATPQEPLLVDVADTANTGP